MQALTLADFKEMMAKLRKIAEVVGLPFAQTASLQSETSHVNR
jgi:hypothetical protein